MKNDVDAQNNKDGLCVDKVFFKCLNREVVQIDIDWSQSGQSYKTIGDGESKPRSRLGARDDETDRGAFAYSEQRC